MDHLLLKEYLTFMFPYIIGAIIIGLLLGLLIRKLEERDYERDFKRNCKSVFKKGIEKENKEEVIEMNILQQITDLETQRDNIDDKLDELYILKQKKEDDFRAKLIGQYFKRGSQYIKILNQLTPTIFSVINITDYSNNKINTKSYLTDDVFNIYINTLYIESIESFNEYKEITEEEFYKIFDKVKNKLKII